MHANIIQIGNSRGIRIPKTILEQCDIKDEIDLDVQDGKIIIASRQRKPREGWEAAFRRMSETGEDALLIDDKIGRAHV